MLYPLTHVTLYFGTTRERCRGVQCVAVRSVVHPLHSVRKCEVSGRAAIRYHSILGSWGITHLLCGHEMSFGLRVSELQYLCLEADCAHSWSEGLASPKTHRAEQLNNCKLDQSNISGDPLPRGDSYNRIRITVHFWLTIPVEPSARFGWWLYMAFPGCNRLRDIVTSPPAI